VVLWSGRNSGDSGSAAPGKGGRIRHRRYCRTETTIRGTDLVWKLARVSGFSLFAASAEEQATAYAAVLSLIASGEIVPAHDRSFPLERAPEALRHLTEDRPFGTVKTRGGGPRAALGASRSRARHLPHPIASRYPGTQ